MTELVAVLVRVIDSIRMFAVAQAVVAVAQSVAALAQAGVVVASTMILAVSPSLRYGPILRVLP